MNTLIHGYLTPTNDFQLNFHSKPVFTDQDHVFGYRTDPGLDEYSLDSKGLSPVDESCLSDENNVSKESSVVVPSTQPFSSDESEGEIFTENDHSDAILKFISQMLMEEEDLENKPCMLHDCLALQATEKSLYDALNNKVVENAGSPNSFSSGSYSDVGSFVESNWHSQEGDFESLMNFPSLGVLESNLQSFGFNDGSMNPFSVLSSSIETQLNLESNGSEDVVNQFLINVKIPSPDSGTSTNAGEYRGLLERNEMSVSRSNFKTEKKNRYREDGDLIEVHRSSKQFANNVGEAEPLELYDEVLLCSEADRRMPACGDAGKCGAKKQIQHNEKSRTSSRGRPKAGKKQGNVKEVVDMRSLLLQCAQAVASYDNRTVNDLLLRIRQHSSPDGDGTERLAHYFANALEARMAGTGPASYTGFLTRISAAQILKAYQTFITACPFKKMSNMLANKTIKKLASGATTLHIVDFGILYGYQWPCLIQALSERPGGPPKLRITGIDFPQPGFRPAERVVETGVRLKKYCERFGVPFEYNAIAQKWETIKLEDIKIQKNEFLVVNSLYRIQNVPDETVMVNSPRDAVLNLIRKMNPDLVIHGIINGTFNTPFFVTRFREALFHFSSLFDMFATTIPQDNEHRKLLEKEVFGMEAMNIIACEGTERVDRPETYKQWQVRNIRAGFKQLPLDKELVKYVRCRVKMDYHKDFSVDEDGKWMLQGWKGRVLNAISFWQPAHK